MTLVLPLTAAEALRDDVARWGSRMVETGALLLGQDSVISVIAWPGTRDVVRERDHFAIGGLALAHLFEWADENDHYVKALVHSHGGRAFLSSVDLRHGFSVPGFVSAIIPHYSQPSADVADWGWWRFDGKWHDLEPPHVHDGAFNEITFDSDGVR